MKTKVIRQVLLPPPPHMVGDGFKVHNFFPSGYHLRPDRMSPFYLLDYNAPVEFSPRQTPRGVGVHPHRGFETVTLVYHGKIAHEDSCGNKGIIGEGDVQWMTAGAGVLHKEYHEKKFSRQGGLFQMVQIWINLPAAYKMTPPAYQSIPHKKIPFYSLPQSQGIIEVIAGEFGGVKGIARTFSPVEMYNFRLRSGVRVDFHLPETYNTGILIVEGKVNVNTEEAVEADRFILFRNRGEKIVVHAVTDSILLVMSGQPLHEPIMAYGPFIMNTKEEIIKGYEDLNAGKFGILED